MLVTAPRIDGSGSREVEPVFGPAGARASQVHPYSVCFTATMSGRLELAIFFGTLKNSFSLDPRRSGGCLCYDKWALVIVNV